MAKKVKFELNMKGLNDLMKSSEMQSVLLEAGQSVAEAAGSGFEAEVHQADFTAISNVYATDHQSRKQNLEDNTLLKAVSTVGLPTHKPRL